MRGATLFFSALLVVVGTDDYVCLKWNSNKVLIVEEEPVASHTAARQRPQRTNSPGLVAQRNVQKHLMFASHSISCWMGHPTFLTAVFFLMYVLPVFTTACLLL